MLTSSRTTPAPSRLRGQHLRWPSHGCLDAEAGSLTEAAFGAYARQQVTAANWTLASSSTDQQTVTNTNNIEFPASTGTTQTITHAFIADASSSGNILFVGALDASKQIASGDIFRINATNLTIELK